MKVCENLQDAETETTGHGNLFLALHVQIPDDEPWEDGEGKVHDDKPCCFVACQLILLNGQLTRS